MHCCKLICHWGEPWECWDVIGVMMRESNECVELEQCIVRTSFSWNKQSLRLHRVLTPSDAELTTGKMVTCGTSVHYPETELVISWNKISYVLQYPFPYCIMKCIFIIL